MKYPEYKVGARWRAENPDGGFTFIIVGPGTKPGHKLCRVEYDREGLGRKNFEQEYPHVHLKIYATYVRPQEG